MEVLSKLPMQLATCASWSPAFDSIGQLYFTSNKDGTAEIYRMNNDGTAEQVTDGQEQ